MSSEVAKEQCASKGPRGVQCTRSRGHAGEHWAGPFTWEIDEETLARLRTPGDRE